jgi:hypothetical protein
MTMENKRSGLMRRVIHPKSRRSRHIAVLVTIAGVATAAWALEDAESPQGLGGIFPAEVPESLNYDAFSALGGNWAEWSATASQAVENLYQSTSKDLAAQKEAIAAARVKLNVMEKALSDPRYTSIYVPLTGLSSALARRVDLAQALLDTLQMEPQAAHEQRLRARAEQVTRALNSLRDSLRQISGGQAWLPYVTADPLAAAMKDHPAGDEALSAARASKEKLTVESANDAQKDFLNRAAFRSLRDAVTAYVTAAENPPSQENSAQLREQFGTLVAALDAYEASKLSADAAKAREAYSAIRRLAPDGGDVISGALQKHYFNYNVRLVASEAFLTKLLSDARTEQGPVSDFILGANVSGWQTTNTNVAVDLKPDRTAARWNLVLTGTILSNTQGVTPQATVMTQGNHAFTAAKQIAFNGTHFTTGAGTISVNPNNTTTGVATRFSRAPIFGRIADRIAYREAEARRGESQAIAAQRVESRVLPEFNREVNNAFAKSEQDLQTELYDHLRETGLYPDAMLYQTTETELRANTRLMGPKELGASQAPAAMTGTVGATAFIHESEMNNGADRIGLAGKTMTDEELRKHLEAFFEKAFNRDFNFEPPAENPDVKEAEEEAEDEGNPPGTFVFADSDPVRIQMQDGTLYLMLRTGFLRENGDRIPQQIITVPLSFEVQGDQIHITRGLVRVEAAEGGGAGQVATAGIIRRKIQKELPERMISARFTLEGPKRKVPAMITNVRIADGWAVVNVQ